VDERGWMASFIFDFFLPACHSAIQQKIINQSINQSHQGQGNFLDPIDQMDSASAWLN